MSIPTLTLNDGNFIPQIGFGVFQVPPEETASIVSTALEVGYRHLDTAQMYGNEAGVGEAISSSDLARDDIFVTTKLNNGFHKPDDARRSFDESLKALGTDYVDLFLIHWPLPTLYDGDFVSTWQTLIEFQKDGRARSIGVSNFEPEHLARLGEETDVVPAVNQIEIHPYFGNTKARAASIERGIVVEAWSPIAQGKILDNEVLQTLADKHERSIAQIALRWHLQRGDVVFPKSSSRERMQENLDLIDFNLSTDDITTISALDGTDGGRIGPDPATFDLVPD